MATDCIFCRIVAGQIPAKIAYRDEHVTAFHDINPQAPLHVLIVPNEHIPDATHVALDHGQVLAHMLRAANQVARDQNLANRDAGYRLVINYGDDAGMTVPHLHLHVLGGRTLTWPPG